MRIRSANLEIYQKYERTIGLKAHSNILGLPKDSKIAKNLDLDEEKANAAFNKEIMKKQPAMHPVIISKITKKELCELPVTSLAKIISKEKPGPRFRVRVNPVALILGEKDSALRGNQKNKLTPKVEKGSKPIFWFEMLVKDFSIMLTDTFVRVLVATHDSKLNTSELFKDLPLTKGQEGIEKAVKPKLE